MVEGEGEAALPSMYVPIFHQLRGAFSAVMKVLKLPKELHELLGEVDHADDEWMYQLQQQNAGAGESDDPRTHTTTVVQLLLKNEFGAAAEALQRVETKANEKKSNSSGAASAEIDSLALRLMEFAEAKLRSENDVRVS